MTFPNFASYATINPSPSRSRRGSTYHDRLSPAAMLDGSGNVVARFVYALGRNVPELMLTSTATYRFVTDHLGSVRLVVNVADGSIAQRIEYDAYGRVVMDTNPAWQPFGFAGGLHESATETTRFGARDYDAETGRWTAKDVSLFGGGINLYAYSRNDPVNRMDRTGLAPFSQDPIDCAFECYEKVNKWTKKCHDTCNAQCSYNTGCHEYCEAQRETKYAACDKGCGE